MNSIIQFSSNYPSFIETASHSLTFTVFKTEISTQTPSITFIVITNDVEFFF